ncbi:MAG: ETC complex I subunit [Nitratireductor sp.]|nr:ETC complex I subunit [Nitratireductor sp.]
METRKQSTQISNPAHPMALQSNDNHIPALAMGRSVFPRDAIAHIYRPSRSVMTSRPAREGWRLVFEPRSPSFIEPLMGYTGSKDTLKQVELRFSTKEAAIRYAQRQGLNYVLHASGETQARARLRDMRAKRDFSDETLDRLGLLALADSYGYAMAHAANQNHFQSSGNWADPMDVVHDHRLSLPSKRSILMNWAWNEYLVDQATNEGMPENGRPSRLGDVEQALVALERKELSPDISHPKQRAA